MKIMAREDVNSVFEKLDREEKKVFSMISKKDYKNIERLKKGLGTLLRLYIRAKKERDGFAIEELFSAAVNLRCEHLIDDTY